MFLRPHHFQAAERYAADQARQSAKFDSHYNWGIRAFDLDPDALKNYRFEVTRLEARLEDGTLITARRGADTALPGIDLKPLFDRKGPGEAVEVRLAVPELQLGKANAPDTADPDPGTRFRVDKAREKTVDENSGQNEQYIDVRRLNVRLMTADQDPAGYSILPLARVVRSPLSNAPLALDAEFFPPVLACDAWPTLRQDIMSSVYNLIGTNLIDLGKTVRDQRIKFDTSNPDQKKMFEQLRVLNEGYAAFGVVARAAGVHPLTGYLELCRFAGQLAAFGTTPMLPDECPAYDHNNLGPCFWTVKKWIEGLIKVGVQRGWEMRPFAGDEKRMTVDIAPEWLNDQCQMLVAVEAPNLKPGECAQLMTGGKMNMKIGQRDRVEEIFRGGFRGLAFAHESRPHPVLPTSPSLTYFRINRDQSRDEWFYVTNKGKLSVRFNDLLVIGAIPPGRPDVTIKAGDGKNATLTFSLYVVLPNAQG
jgi:type VI secretion system protein ImpJ